MLIHNPIFTGSISLNGTDISQISTVSSDSSSFASRITLTESTASAFILASGSFSTRVTLAEATASALVTASGSLSTRVTAAEATASAFITASGSLSARIASNEARTGSFATTGSNQFNGSQTVTGSLTATGTIVAQTLVVQTITSSVDFVTGSAKFGSIIDNTHQFTGSVLVSGSQTINGSITVGDLISTSYGTARIQVTSTTNSANAGFRYGAKDSAGTAKNAGIYYIAGTTTATTFLSLSANDNDYQLNVLANGNVGIGFTAPSSSLAVNGNASIGSNLSPSSLPHGLDTNGRSLIIAGSGVNPNYGVLFLVNNSTEATGALLGGVLYAQVTSEKSGTNAATKAGISAFATGSGGSVGGFGGYMALYTRPDNAANDIGSYERMRIDMNGNVGIGTTSPTQGKLVVSNAGPSVIANRETSQGVNSSWNASDGSLTFFGNTSNHPLVFITNNTERLQITSTGNTIITADAGNEQFIIRRASNNNAQLIIGYHSSGYGRIQAVEQGVAFRTLALNESGGAVGIGTTAPNTQLHVVGSLTVNDVIYLQRSSTSLFLPIANYWNGSGNPLAGTKGDILAIGNSGGDGLVFVNSNTERMRITSGGNVGIGATSPGVRLVNSGATLASVPTLGSGTIGANAILSANGLYGLYTGVSSEGWVWQQVQRNDANSAVYSLVLQPSGGNVGIGITSPSTKLHIQTGSISYGQFRITSTTNSAGEASMNFSRTDQAIDNGWTIGQGVASIGDSFGFYTGGSARMTLTTSGSVFVGGTSITNNTRFAIIGSGVWDGAAIGLSNTGTGGQVYTIFSTNNAFSQGGSNLLFYNATLGTNNLILYSNGNYDFMGSDVSDRRLKQDIEDLNYGLDEIMELSPKSYHLKSKNNLDGNDQTTLRKRYGFIAQEIQPVLPDAITGEETETDYLGLDYNGVLAVAVKAIQELSAKVSALEAQQ